jgi:hypothetical protein
LNQAKEFEYYVEYGMTPMQAIRSGTVVAAELLGWSDKLGTVEAGKWADLVAASGDPLKDITEVEINLTGVVKPRPTDQVKGFITYSWNTYGSYIGAKLVFTNLFESMSEEDMLKMSGPGAKAMEVNVAPMLDAPPPPTGSVATAVTAPLAGNGVTAEESAAVAKELRKQLGRLGGYDVMSEGDMAQLATEPCGDGDCGVKFGRALRQQAVVVGRLQRTNAGLALSLRMVGVTDSTVSPAATAAGADMKALTREIPGLMKRLTRPEPPAQTGGAR